MNCFEEHTTIDGVLTCTLIELKELLDVFDLDDCHEIYHSLFRKKTRLALKPYMRKRMVDRK